MADLTDGTTKNVRTIYEVQFGESRTFAATLDDARWQNRIGNYEGVIIRHHFVLTREGVTKLLNHLVAE